MRAGWIAFVLVLAAPAAAQKPEKPWAAGVSENNKAQAQKLLEEGNELFARERHKEALDIYVKALASWDHPAIRFNAVRALIALDRLLEANEYLTKALAYGREPFDEDLYREALNYQRLLRGQLASIEVKCEQRGVTFALDAGERIACPATRELQVLPGGHRVVAEGAGLVSISRDVAVGPGKRELVTFQLEPQISTRVERRWKPWIPYAVVGGGVAITGMGIVFNLLARDAKSELDDRVTLECGASGCSPDRYRELGLADLEDRVETRNAISLVSLSLGVATIAAGGVMVLLNRPTLRKETVKVSVTNNSVVLGVSF